MENENLMRQIYLEKVTLNIGAGKEQALLEKSMKLIEHLTGKKPIKTLSKKRIPAWGLRPGLPIGCKLTLRGEEAENILKRMLNAKSHKLSQEKFDNEGNVTFGLTEYIDIEGAKYDPEIGVIGLQITATLHRAGYRVRTRKIQKKALPKRHRISREEAVKFMKDNFRLKIAEEEETEE